MATQSLLGSVIVFHAQAHDRLTFRPRDEGIEIVNIELGFEKSGHETIEIGGICFDDDEVALGEGKVFGDEQFASAVRIVHDDANDGAVGGVEDHQAQDVDVFGIEEADKVVEAANFIWGKNGELDYRVYPPRLSGFSRHSVRISLNPPRMLGKLPWKAKKGLLRL